MAPHRTLVILALAGALLAAGCGTDDPVVPPTSPSAAPTTTSPTTTSVPPSADAPVEVPESVSVRCELDPDRFEVLEPAPITAAEAAAAGCGTLEDRTWWAIRSGVDRERFTVTGNYGAPMVELVVPGDGCVTTQEYRGEMVLLVASDAVPELGTVTQELPC